MKRICGFTYPPYSRKSQKKYICHGCGKVLDAKEAYFSVDGNNYAITANAPPYCKECCDERGLK